MLVTFSFSLHRSEHFFALTAFGERAARFRAAMTRVFRAREARFRSMRDFKRRCARVCGGTKKKKNWETQREWKVAPCVQQRDDGKEGREGWRGGGVGRRWNHKSVKMFCNFEIRRACWFAPKRVTGNRQPAGCGQHRHPPQKRIAVPSGNTH